MLEKLRVKIDEYFLIGELINLQRQFGNMLLKYHSIRSIQKMMLWK